MIYNTSKNEKIVNNTFISHSTVLEMRHCTLQCVHNSIVDQLLKNDNNNWHNKNSPIVIKCFVRPFLFLQGFDPHFSPFQGYDFGLLDNIHHIK